MIDNYLSQVLADRAGDIEPRSDLVAAVERGYRRRRRRRGAVTAAVSVLGVVVFTAIVVAGAPRPAPDADGPWKVPVSFGSAPRLADVWPAAVLAVPDRTPNGGTARVLGEAAPGVVMVVGISGATSVLYRYDAAAHAYGPPLASLGTGVGPGNWAFHGDAMVYGVNRDGGAFDVYRVSTAAPGVPAYLARVDGFAGDSPWVLTDDGLYLSPAGPGVLRVPAGGGTAAPLAGFADYRIVDRTGWAAAQEPIRDKGLSVDAGLRNIAGGPEIVVTVPAGEMSLHCVPAFCVGMDRDGAFLQRPDGTGRQPLPPAMVDPRPVVSPSGGLVVAQGYGLIVFDPVTGRMGVSGTRDATATTYEVGPAAIGWSTPSGTLTTTVFEPADVPR